MDFFFQFTFRTTVSQGPAYIDYSDQPVFIFTLLLDKDLVAEFGDDVTIKTDFYKILARQDDKKPGLSELRKALFQAIKKTEEFQFVKNRAEKLKVGTINGKSSQQDNHLN